MQRVAVGWDMLTLSTTCFRLSRYWAGAECPVTAVGKWTLPRLEGQERKEDGGNRFGEAQERKR